ncbi:hypothetical protein L6R50_05470 [Myxococcota bacterium]|nr:hypothetical protein [Myxococcota bacterium]
MAGSGRSGGKGGGGGRGAGGKPGKPRLPVLGSPEPEAGGPGEDLGKVDFGLSASAKRFDVRFGPWTLRIPRGERGLQPSDLWVTLIELLEEGEGEWILPDRPHDLTVAFGVEGPTVDVGVFGPGRYRGEGTPGRLQVRLRAMVDGIAAALEGALEEGDPEIARRADDLRGDLALAREAVAGLPAGWERAGGG